MRRLICVIALALFSASAHATDEPVAAVNVAALGGRMEILASGIDGKLYRTRQPSNVQGWSDWSSVLPATVSRIATIQSKSGPLFNFAIDNGQIAIRRQTIIDADFLAGTQKIGNNFNSLAVALNADDLFDVLAIAEDGTLSGAQQKADGSWGALQSIGGHDLAGGGVLGKLGPYLVHPNALAGTMGAGNLFNAFAIGGDGQLYVAVAANTHALPSVWSSLQGAGLVDVQAITVGGCAVVVAQDRGGNLLSRSQSPNGSWSPWKAAFDQSVLSWTMAPDGFGSALLFMSTANSGVSIRTFVPQDGFLDNSGVDFIAPPDGAMLPLGPLSVVVGNSQQAMLAVTDVAGAVFVRPIVVSNGNIEFAQSIWARVGKIAPTPNVPDLAVAANGCIISGSDVDNLTSGLPLLLNQTPGLESLSAPINQTNVCQPARAQSIGIWLGEESSPSTFPPGIMKSAGKTPELYAIRITRSGLDRLLAGAWSAMQKRQSVGDGYDIIIKSVSYGFGKDEIDLHIKGNFMLGALPVAMQFDVKSHLSVDPDGRLDCTPSISGNSKVLQILSGVFAPLAGNFGWSRIITDQSQSFLKDAAVVCSLVSSLPTDVLLTPVAGMPLQKEVFSYNMLDTSSKDGLTVFAQAGPFATNRNPRVDWQVVDGNADKKDSNQISFEFVASSADMNNANFAWSSSWPQAQIVSLEPQQRVVKIEFPAPPSRKAGQVLGTLTLSAMDADGQTGSTVHTVTITEAMLKGSPPKNPDDIPSPLLPR